MQRDWDERARENARYYVDTGKQEWTDDEFFRSGERTVAEEILTDMINICQGKDPKQMRVLEIGCGAGRVTRALSGLFGEVYGVDVSGEMVRQARAALADRPNAFVYQNNGKDLSVVGDRVFDFAFSTIVFQHIPSREVIENYVREVHRAVAPRSAVQIPGAGRRHTHHIPRRYLARRAFLRRSGRCDGRALRIRAALPARRRSSVFLALVFQAAVGVPLTAQTLPTESRARRAGSGIRISPRRS